MGRREREYSLWAGHTRETRVAPGAARVVLGVETKPGTLLFSLLGLFESRTVLCALLHQLEGGLGFGWSWVALFLLCGRSCGLLNE